MNLIHLREVATYHGQMASAFERDAELAATHRPDAIPMLREKAQWHASTSLHLHELADAFEAVRPLLTLNP